MDTKERKDDLLKFDFLKMLGTLSLPEIIDRDARSLKLSELVEPAFEPPNDDRELIPFGELPEDLKALKRLAIWYGRKISTANDKEDCVERKAIVEAFYNYIFKQVYIKRTPKGFSPKVCKGWQVIACPISPK